MPPMSSLSPGEDVDEDLPVEAQCHRLPRFALVESRCVRVDQHRSVDVCRRDLADRLRRLHRGKPTLMLRIGNGRATLLSDATAKLNVLMCEAGIDGKMLHRAQELRLERAHIPVFPLSWTIMHVLDEHSPLQGYDTARTIEADAQLFVMFEARDPTLVRWCTTSETMRRAIYVSATPMWM